MEYTNTDTKKPRSRKKLVAAIAACGLVLAGGITVASVTASRASAEETSRICTAALSDGAAAAQAGITSSAAADKALAAVKVTTLPKGAGTSTLFEKHPAVKAAKTVPARASGAEFIGDVAHSKTALTGITIPAECTDRYQAAGITAAAAKHTTAAKALDTSVEALQADFTVFQGDEAKRIAAEKKAAAEKAAAAKKKAEAEAAAKQKAAQAAAEAAAAATAQAAAQAQAQEAPPYVAPEPAPGGGYAPAPAPYVPDPAAAPGGGSRYGGSTSTPGGGGSVFPPGTPKTNGVCHLSNGIGGTTTVPGPCP